MSEREEIRRAGLPVSDLRKKTVASNAQLDLAALADTSWTVCTVCDCPSIETPDGSMCCGAGMRIQGWTDLRCRRQRA